MKMTNSTDKDYKRKKRWAINHRDKCHQSDKDWRTKNKDKKNINQKKYYQNHKLQIKEYMKKYLKEYNKKDDKDRTEYMKEYNKNYYQSHKTQKEIKRVPSEITRQKIRESVITFFKENPQAKENLRQFRFKQVLPMKDTLIEIKIQNFLANLKIEYFTHRYMHIEHGYQCDILIPSIKTIIECDGDYWHGNPKFYTDEKLTERQKKQRENDKIRTRELEEKGFQVIRLWESEITSMNYDDFMVMINERRKIIT